MYFTTRIESVLSALAIVSSAIWWGGLTFYAAVVVPIGSELLSNTTQGFITQQVTHWLNLACLLALFTTSPAVFRTRNRLAVFEWAVVGLTLVGLIFIHRSLSTFLDVDSMTVQDPARFYSVHRWYLLFTTLQWIAGGMLLIHISRPAIRFQLSRAEVE